MAKKAKRILSLVLIFSMMMSMFSMSAYADPVSTWGPAYDLCTKEEHVHDVISCALEIDVATCPAMDLDCTLHVHDDTCEHEHEDSCYELICNEELVTKDLICTKELGHVHSVEKGCYETHDCLVNSEQCNAVPCTVPAVGGVICSETDPAHVHGDGCYETHDCLVNSEQCNAVPCTIPVVGSQICQKEENHVHNEEIGGGCYVAHVHTLNDCYTIICDYNVGDLDCEFKDDPAHVHVEAIDNGENGGCYKAHEHVKGVCKEKCTKEVYKHSSACTSEDAKGFIYEVTDFDEDDVSGTVSATDVKNTVITMKRGETKYYKWEFSDAAKTAGEPEELYGERSVWTIEDGHSAVDIEQYNSLLDEATAPGGEPHSINSIYQYHWLKVTAVEPGYAQIKLEYPVVTDRDIDSAGKVTKTYYGRLSTNIYINVVETTVPLYIDDQIAANGCLVPVFSDPNFDATDVTYEWSRSDYQPVKADALHYPYAVQEGAVNVGIDRGGIDDNNGNPAVNTYTVIARNAEGTEITRASYTVPYGNEVLNGSFEYPVASIRTHDYPNDAAKLYWKTTSKSVREQEVCQDIEIIRKGLSTADDDSMVETYGLSKLNPDKNGTAVVFNGTKLKYAYTTDASGARVIDTENSDVVADVEFKDENIAGGGMQIAEINCDAPGALYQDVLTYPGAEMYWELWHRARNYSGSSAANGGAWLPDGVGYKYTVAGTEEEMTDHKDYMYVIIAPTAQVEHITTQEQLDDLIDNARNAEGKFVSGKHSYGSIDYHIWEVADDHTAWNKHANAGTDPYIVEDDAYLTRFFFAAGSNQNDRVRVARGDEADHSGGNFIDAVVFSNEMPYTVEYYLDGDLVQELTQTGKAAPGSDTVIPARNTGAAALDGKHLIMTQVNGNDNNGQTVLNGLYKGHNTLQLYYVSYAIGVNKTVTVEGFDTMPDDVKAAIKSGLTANTLKFKLFEDNVEISTVDVEVNPDTLTGAAEFKDANENSILPVEGKTYRIEEVNAPTMKGLILERQDLDEREAAAGEVVLNLNATNAYKVALEETLTATKTLAGANLAADQFSFELKDEDGQVLQTKKNAADGSITFDPITYGYEDLGKVYTYKISEVEGNAYGYTYDKTEKTVKVSVGLHNGVLDAEANYVDGAAFANSYYYNADGSVTLFATKVLKNKTLTENQFSFELKDEDGQVLQTKKNAADGSVTFDPISYDEDDIGSVFTYKISEVDDGQNNYTYDTHVETVTVTVRDLGEGELTAVPSYDADGSVFTNTYKRPYVPTETVSCTVTKVWNDNGDEAGLRPESITVQLKDGGKVIETATLSAENGWSKTWSELSEDGDYSVAEVNVPEGYTSSVTGGSTSFTITNTYVPPIVEPEEPEIPTGDKELEDPLYDLEDGDVPHDYMEIGDPDVPKTSDNSMLALWLTLAIMSGLALAGLTIAEKKRG